MMRKGLVLFCTAALVTVTAQPLLAGGIDNKHNWSAEYIRTLNRNAATDSADIVAYNPAGIMAMENSSYVNLSAHYIGKTYTNIVDGTELESDKPSVVPGLFSVYKTDRWAAFFGLTVCGGGGIVEYDQGSATTKIAQAMLAPTVTTSQQLEAESKSIGYTLGGAYKFNDMASASLGLRYINADKSMKSTLVNGTLGTLLADYEQEATGWGIILGLNISPSDTVNIGLRYETSTELNYKYTVNQDTPLTLLGQPGLLQQQGITNGMKKNRDLPALLGLGTSLQVNSKLKVDVNLTYYFNKDADWEGAENNVDNGYDLGAAIEYAINGKTKASLGFMHTDVGIDAQNMLAEAPQLDANTIGTGIAYKYNDNIDLNFSLGKVFYDDASFTHALTGQKITYEKDIIFLGLGAQYKF